MFSGIIKNTGKIIAVKKSGQNLSLAVSIPKVKAAKGESIALNGACLTVSARRGYQHTFLLMPETLKRANLSGLVKGDKVNIERPLVVGDRLNGHIVQGHIDAALKIKEIINNKKGIVVKIDLPPKYKKLVIKKGSLSLDGVSLTVADIGQGWFSVALIPHTLANTTLGIRQKNDKVNIEFDILAKYARA